MLCDVVYLSVMKMRDLGQYVFIRGFENCGCSIARICGMGGESYKLIQTMMS